MVRRLCEALLQELRRLLGEKQEEKQELKGMQKDGKDLPS